VQSTNDGAGIYSLFLTEENRYIMEKQRRGVLDYKRHKYSVLNNFKETCKDAMQRCEIAEKMDPNYIMKGQI
jgi:hypothetical protein